LQQKGQTLADASGWCPRMAAEALSHSLLLIEGLGTIPVRSADTARP
jgi:hypothetical protein